MSNDFIFIFKLPIFQECEHFALPTGFSTHVVRAKIHCSYNGKIDPNKGVGSTRDLHTSLLTGIITLLHCRAPFRETGSIPADGTSDWRAGVVAGLATAS